MVLRDYYSENPKISEKTEALSAPAVTIANPFDRFGAQVLDLAVVFFPLFGLLSAPLKKAMTESAHYGNWQTVGTLAVEFLLVFFIVYLLSQLLSRMIFKNSFGKKVMGLKVVNLWTGRDATTWENMVRSSYVFLEFLFLGLPFLLVLTNKKYRGLHDQLTDTMVVNLRGELPPALNVRPLRWMLRFSAFVGVASVFAFGIHLGGVLLQQTDPQAAFQMSQGDEDEDASASCEKTGSLEKAMALVASGYMDTSCLKDEVDTDFVAGAQPTPLDYLAKSFVYVDHPDLSDQYLKKVCEVKADSAACVLAEFISSWSDGDKSQVEEILEKAKDYREPYLSLWALRYYQQMGLYRKSLEFAQGLTKNKQFGIYVRAQVLKSKYFLNDVAGSDRDLASMEKDSESPVVSDTMAWSCLKKISKSCENTSDSFCRRMMEADPSDYFYQPRILLSQIRMNECQGNEVDPNSYAKSGQPRAWKEFIYALDKEKKGDMKSAWSLYAEVARLESTPDYLRAEAIRRMSLHPDISDISALKDLASNIETYENRHEAAQDVRKVYRRLHLESIDGSENGGGRLPASEDGGAR